MMNHFDHSLQEHSENNYPKVSHFRASVFNTQKRRRFSPLFLTIIAVFLLGNMTFCFGQESNSPDHCAVDLRCEYLVNPIGLNILKPRLSWRLFSDGFGVFQSAYRIMAAESKEDLDRNQGNLWDSGIVKSRESLGIVYEGKPLESGKRYFWKVKTWNQENKESGWSEIAIWETGLLYETDWQGVWINDGKKNPVAVKDFYKEDPAPLFRHEFNCEKKIKNARLYIAGLGYFEARLNGKIVGNHVLDPAWTKPTKRVFYSTFDVTKQLLAEGQKNCLGVMLGNGWYNPLPMKMWGNRNIREALDVGRPRFIVQLNIIYEDGSKKSFYSQPSWKVSEGPLRRNNVYLGEVYDARLDQEGWDKPGFNDSSWQYAKQATESIGKLHGLNMPPVRVRDTFHAVSVKEPKPGVFVYDMGENFGGWASLTLNAPKGTKIVLRYGELIYPDGMLNPMTSVCGQIKRMVKNAQGSDESMGGPGAPNIAWQSDTYFAKGGRNEYYRPRFTFHAFRYLEISGLDKPIPLEAVQGWRLCSDLASNGEFSCSNNDFNRIQDICRRTFLSNVFSVQSDCPHRERFGYGGDIVATDETFIMNFDMASFYAKAVNDWSDSALEEGMLTDTSPFVGIQYCGLVWAMAHPKLIWQLHRYYGNNRLIEEQYETARQWLSLVQKKYPDLLVPEGLSDHEYLITEKPEILVTPMFYFSARLLEQLALQLNHRQEAREYAQLAEKIASVYRRTAINAATGKVGTGTQAAQSFSLYTDFVFPGFLSKDLREKVLAFLLDSIKNKDKEHLTTGILGTKFLLDQLSQEQGIDVAYKIANQPDFPGWRWMLQNNATTLWEHWAKDDNIFSHNHPMFGSISQWFFQRLGGIMPDDKSNGFDLIRICPNIVPELNWVKTSYQSVRGEIVSRWNRDKAKETLTFNFTIPANTKASVVLPVGKKDLVTAFVVNHKGTPLKISSGEMNKIFASDWSAAGRKYSLNSGRYLFIVSLAPIQ